MTSWSVLYPGELHRSEQKGNWTAIGKHLALATSAQLVMVVTLLSSMGWSMNTSSCRSFSLQVPVEPFCKNVPGPSVPRHQPDLLSAARGSHPSLHVRRLPSLQPQSILLSPDAAYACGPWPTGSCGACTLCSSVDWDPLRDQQAWVSLNVQHVGCFYFVGHVW